MHRTLPSVEGLLDRARFLNDGERDSQSSPAQETMELCESEAVFSEPEQARRLGSFVGMSE